MLLNHILKEKKKPPKRTMNRLTRQIYEYMIGFAERHGGITPTVRTIQDALGISSTSVVQAHKKKLIKQGLLAPVPGTQMVQIANGKFSLIPVYRSGVGEMFRRDVSRAIYINEDAAGKKITVTLADEKGHTDIIYNFGSRLRITCKSDGMGEFWPWDDALFTYEVGLWLLPEITGDREYEW